MNPLIIPIIASAAAQLGGGYLASQESKKGRESAERIAKENLALQREQFKKQQELADRLLRMQTATTTSAQGDITGYDEETGWYTKLGPETRRLVDLISGAQRGQIATQVPLAKRQAQRSDAQQAATAPIIQALLSQMQTQRTPSAEEIRSNLAVERRQGIAEQTAPLQQALARTVSRQGGDPSKAIAAFAKGVAPSMANTSGDYLRSLEAANSLRTGGQNSLANLIASLTQSSRGNEGVNIPQMNLPSTAQQQALLPQAGGSVLNAYGSSVPSSGVPYQPDYTMASLVTGGGNLLTQLIPLLTKTPAPTTTTTTDPLGTYYPDVITGKYGAQQSPSINALINYDPITEATQSSRLTPSPYNIKY